MEQEFQIPARPWGEAEVKYLAKNVHLLDEETRTELGFVKVEPIEDFKADVDTTVDTPAVCIPANDPVVATMDVDGEKVELTQSDVDAGLAAFAALSPEEQEAARAEAQAQEATGLPTDTDGVVVDNPTPDNA